MIQEEKHELNNTGVELTDGNPTLNNSSGSMIEEKHVVNHRDFKSLLIKTLNETLPRLLTHNILPWRQLTIALAMRSASKSKSGERYQKMHDENNEKSEGYDLYLMSEFDIKECKEMKGNAVILTNKNTAYFIIEDKIVMKDDKPQTVAGINRQKIAPSDSIKPKEYTALGREKEEIIKEATLKGGQTQSEEKEKSNDTKYFNRKQRITQFYDGVEAISTGLWRPAFLGMFIYDLINYFHEPNNRYQMDIISLISGVGGHKHNYNYHYAALTANLGSDLPIDWNFWPWIFLVGGSLFSGIINSICLIDLDVDFDFSSEEPRDTCEKIKFELLNNFSSLGDHAKKLFAIQFLLEAESSQNPHIQEPAKVILRKLIKESDLDDLVRLNKRKKELIKYLNDTINCSSFLARLAAIRVLTAICYNEQHRPEKNEDTKKIFNKITGWNLFSLYAQYHIWSSGYAKKLSTHLFCYFLIFPLQLFTQMRWWSLIINKIWQLYQFYSDKNRCDTDQKVWHFVVERGNYECTTCDWDIVDYRSSLTGQGCVTALLATPYNNSKELLGRLNRLVGHGPFYDIDFSTQPWTQWTATDWKNITNVLKSFSLNGTTLNLSRAMFIPQAVPNDLFKSVADLLGNSGIETLDLSRQYLAQQGMESLLPGLQNNPRIQKVIFNNSLLADTTASLFLRIIPTMPKLTAISMKGCGLTGYNMSLINGALTNSSEIQSIDLSDNPIASVHIEELAGNLSYSQVTEIYLDGIDLTDMNITRFGNGVIASSVTRLSLNNCQITDRIASRLFPFIASTLIKFLQWSNNQIGYNSLISIGPLLAGSKISHFILDNNYVDDDALILLSPAVGSSNSSLTELSLSGNPFTAASFSKFVPAITNGSLTTLNVARTPIGDQGVRGLIGAINNTSSLHTIDLSTVRMTSAGASDLFYGIAHTQVTALDVSHNQVGVAAGEPLQVALNGSVLVSINLADTQLMPDLSQQTLAVLPYSNIRLVILILL